MAEALAPFREVVDQMETPEMARLGPLIIPAMAYYLGVDVVVVPAGPKGVQVLTNEVMIVLDYLLRHDGDLEAKMEALAAVGDHQERLNNKVYQALQGLSF